VSISTWLLDPTTPHRAVGNLVSRRWQQVQNGEYRICIALRRPRVRRGTRPKTPGEVFPPPFRTPSPVPKNLSRCCFHRTATTASARHISTTRGTNALSFITSRTTWGGAVR